MTITDTNLKNQVTAVHNLEVQIGQISYFLANRPQRSLPSNTETNSKEQVRAITLRSDRVLEQNQYIRAEVKDNKDTDEKMWE